jgi:hypothetical protein
VSEGVARTGTTMPGAVLFGVAGGGIAWFAHLALAYLVAEFGCVGGWDEIGWLGLTAVTWSLIGVTVVCVAGAGLATYAAWRHVRAGGRGGLDGAMGPENGGTLGVMARVGLVLSGLFVFIILVESVPILYFLGEC